MPGFDGTGPQGIGPMTGGGRGLCTPYARTNVTGFVYRSGFGRPIGRGRGRGFGRGAGRGMGRGMRYPYAYGARMPYTPIAYGPPPYV